MKPIFIVAGAPGVGKTSACAWMQHQGACVVFDMDQLLIPVSDLLDTDMRTAAAYWPRYNQLWFEILRLVAANNQIPVLFTPISPAELDSQAIEVKWLLLDCPDPLRRIRLQARGWGEERIDDALADASKLRAEIKNYVNVADLSVADVADKVKQWIGVNS